MELPVDPHWCSTGPVVRVNAASSIDDRVKVLRTREMFEPMQPMLAFPLGQM